MNNKNNNNSRNGTNSSNNNQKKEAQETIDLFSAGIKKSCCAKCQITNDKSECPESGC